MDASPNDTIHMFVTLSRLSQFGAWTARSHQCMCGLSPARRVWGAGCGARGQGDSVVWSQRRRIATPTACGTRAAWRPPRPRPSPRCGPRRRPRTAPACRPSQVPRGTTLAGKLCKLSALSSRAFRLGVSS